MTCTASLALRPLAAGLTSRYCVLHDLSNTAQDESRPFL